MRARLPATLAVAALSLGLSAAPQGQNTQPTASLAGDGTFRLYCASCHGKQGQGDGPLAAALKRRPPDLTRLASAHGGTFPADMVARVIDGRKPLKGHGGGEMPVWGDAFANTTERTSPEERIARLVSFLETIQVTR